jgi:prevent-host-death family protein
MAHPFTPCPDTVRTVQLGTIPVMSHKKHYGAEEARSCLPELLERAHHGVATMITKRGRPYATLTPAEDVRSRVSLLALRGTGRGLWGRDPKRTVGKLRDEW